MGYGTTCEARRRRESRAEAQEHRARPRRRRKGAPPRHELRWSEGRPSLFRREELAPSFGAGAGETPKGALSPAPALEQLTARARAGLRIDDLAGTAKAALSSANSQGQGGGQAAWVAETAAALEAVRSLGLLPGSWEVQIEQELADRCDQLGSGVLEDVARVRRRELERYLAGLEQLPGLLVDAQLHPVLAPARAWAAFRVLFGRSARISHRQRDRLERWLRRGDREWGPGGGAGELFRLMADHRDLLSRGHGVKPASIAYFLPVFANRVRAARCKRRSRRQEGSR
jgi:hypothetical protein